LNVDLLPFFERYGVNILTLIVALLLTQKDAIRGWINRRTETQSLEDQQRRLIDERVWAKALGNGVPTTKDLINRLLAQADNHSEKMRDRDVQQERIVKAALSAMEDQAVVARAMLDNQEKLIKPLILGIGEIVSTLDRLLEASAVQIEIQNRVVSLLKNL
jgi:hypothetical protein